MRASEKTSACSIIYYHAASSSTYLHNLGKEFRRIRVFQLRKNSEALFFLDFFVTFFVKKKSK
jgi:hypothetical protein